MNRLKVEKSDLFLTTDNVIVEQKICEMCGCLFNLMWEYKLIHKYLIYPKHPGQKMMEYLKKRKK